MSKELSEMCPLGEKMAKIWLKLQENGEKKSQMAKVMAKVMAKEKYILARTLVFHYSFAYPQNLTLNSGSHRYRTDMQCSR